MTIQLNTTFQLAENWDSLLQTAVDCVVYSYDVSVAYIDRKTELAQVFKLRQLWTQDLSAILIKKGVSNKKYKSIPTSHMIR